MSGIDKSFDNEEQKERYLKAERKVYLDESSCKDTLVEDTIEIIKDIFKSFFSSADAQS